MNAQRDFKWLKMALPVPWTDDVTGIIALDTKVNRPVAAALFNMWTDNSVCAHWWIDKPLVMRHGFFEECCKYVFDTCGRKTIIGIIPDVPDGTSLKLALHMGFKEVARINDGVSDGVDQIILTASIADAEASRWYEVDYGLFKQSVSA